MFVCGPTVYDFSHVGHARTYVAYDIIARYLRARGYSVFYVVNITDIDDKIIRRANESGEDPLTLADRFTKEFFRDMETLKITSVNLYAKASDHVPEIIHQIKTLLAKGYAYQVDGDVYYDVSKFTDYGKLSKQNIEQLTMHRVDPDPRKKNVTDFAMWKGQKPGEPFWDSPWGKGRPGWHIEDTAITVTYFGPQYDVHGGGMDLVFPHHEAEIAQAEAATGVKPLVRHWLHAGLLMISGARMGKSMGNFITIKEAARKHDPEALRVYYAMSHYRSPLEFDEENVYQAEQVLDKLRSTYTHFSLKLRNARLATNEDDRMHGTVAKLSDASIKEFNEAMDEDFNTPKALAALIAFGRAVEELSDKALTKNSLQVIVETFDYFGSVFGIFQEPMAGETQAATGLMELLVELREEARKRGDWSAADRIRDRLKQMGIVVEDTPKGPRWHRSAKRAE